MATPHRGTAAAYQAGEDRPFDGGLASFAAVKIETMTARDEILAALPSIEARNLDGTFNPQDVVEELRRRGTKLADSTIRAHVASRMCDNAPDNHARTYDDLVRVSAGHYRRR